MSRGIARSPRCSCGCSCATSAWPCLVYFAFLTLTYMAITIGSAIQIHRYFRRRSGVALLRVLRSWMTPPVTICVAAYNEEASIVASVRAMLTLDYPEHEVALTNDGSTDATLDLLSAAFNLRRVDQPVPRAALAAVRSSIALARTSALRRGWPSRPRRRWRPKRCAGGRRSGRDDLPPAGAEPTAPGVVGAAARPGRPVRRAWAARAQSGRRSPASVAMLQIVCDVAEEFRASSAPYLAAVS